MRTQWQNCLKIAAVGAACAALFGCGGGGSGPTAATTPPNFTANCAGGVTKTSSVSQADADAQCAASSSIVGSIPVATYLAGSEELTGFTLLNSERSRCGFGQLAQSAQLDASAKASADWLQVNHYTGHIHVTGTPGFTGVTAQDRNASAGYSSTQYAEAFADATGTNAKTGYGQISVRGLLVAPYHMSSILGDAREVGVSIRNATDSASSYGPRVVSMYELASKDSAGPQLADPSAVMTYPCDGSTGVQPYLTGEDPNPVPGRNLSTSPLGTSLYIAVRRNSPLVIASASLTKIGDGTVVALRPAITWNNDPASLYRSHEAYIAADAPLDSNTVYQATVTGTNNGVAFSRTFTFTTGN